MTKIQNIINLEYLSTNWFWILNFENLDLPAP